MDTDKLIEKLDEEGLIGDLEEHVIDNANELAERLDELDDNVIELVLENI